MGCFHPPQNNLDIRSMADRSCKRNIREIDQRVTQSRRATAGSNHRIAAVSGFRGDPLIAADLNYFRDRAVFEYSLDS
jgi:hypothetical protein